MCLGGLDKCQCNTLDYWIDVVTTSPNMCSACCDTTRCPAGAATGPSVLELELAKRTRTSKRLQEPMAGIRSSGAGKCSTEPNPFLCSQNCRDLSGQSNCYCGYSQDPGANFNDGSGCACNWGYIYVATAIPDGTHSLQARARAHAWEQVPVVVCV
jgi:hypothetical protein